MRRIALSLVACLRLTDAWASTPAGLDDLVSLALTRDPAVLAAALDADAARARSLGARQLMSPQLLVGGEMLGGMESMYMLGAQQMFTGWGERRARSDRFSLAAERSEADAQVVEAELRMRLWQAAARLLAAHGEVGLLEEQERRARALLDVGLARYASGATSSGAMTPMAGAMPGGDTGVMGGGASMPTVAPSSQASAGMAGMPGSGGSSPSSARPVQVPQPSMAVDAGMQGGGTALAEPSSLPGLLRLEAVIERLRAERLGVDAEIEGERDVLALFVGEEAADAAMASPSSFLGGDASAPPELRLADLDVEAAEADIEIARAVRRPDVMLAVLGRMTPEEEYMGTDVMVGVTLPVGGGLTREIAAARAQSSAASARRELVTRNLAVSRTSVRAMYRAARARSDALGTVAVPRANAAFLASTRLLAEGAETLQDAVLSWDAVLQARRELIAARRDVELRAAELARLGGSP